MLVYQTGHQDSSLKTALQIYSLYRLLQISALLAIFLLGGPTGSLGKADPFLFLVTALLYFIFCTATLIQSLVKQLPDIRGIGVLLIFLTDLLAFGLFMHFSGGISGSLGILMVVSVAAAGIFLPRRMALFIAAIASISILSEQIYLYLNFSSDADNFAATGILGFALFGAALIVQQLAERLRDSEALISEQSVQVNTLEKINEQIIENMDNGVIVVDNELHLQFMNTAAWRLLNTPNIPEHTPLNVIAAGLERQIRAWQQNAGASSGIFQSNSTRGSLNVRFVQSGSANTDDSNSAGTIIFLEDATLMSQRAQKMKLASLGTLTAGIAHEIRNPLGAISHAAQLLSESEQLVEADQRLTNIVQQHSERINRIIENVLQLSRQKTPQLETINLKHWIKQFCKEFQQSKTEDISLHLTFKEAISEIDVDTSQFTQVLTNLFENGIRYSLYETGENYLDVTCGYDEHFNQHFIEIRDHGPGIPESQIEHIFEPFFTTDSKGSGLGLYIAKELCENNKSELEYIKEKQGACFRINFAH